MTQTQPAVPDLLIEAANLIEKRGWTRGTYEDSNGCLCTLGALQAVTYGQTFNTISPIEHGNTEAAGSYYDAQSALAIRVGNVTRWNDDDDRTKEEVVATLRAAAEANR